MDFKSFVLAAAAAPTSSTPPFLADTAKATPNGISWNSIWLDARTYEVLGFIITAISGWCFRGQFKKYCQRRASQVNRLQRSSTV